MKKAFVVVGLGFGDESKGAWTSYLADKYNAELVVRYCGGSQCGHNVQLENGYRHTFSQFGAGTFSGAKTYLSKDVIINIPALKHEADSLVENGRIIFYVLMNKLHVDPYCLVSTIFHQRANHIKEISRASDPNSIDRHGSCGHGIGETRSYWLKYGNDAIFASDLKNKNVLYHKLELLRQRYLLDTNNKNFYDLTSFDEAENLYRIADKYLFNISGVDDIKFETVIFEGAQGILLDEYYGFHPHTTWSTVTPHHALSLAKRLKIDDVKVFGATRTYTTRHGAGPFPSYNKIFTERLIADPGNPDNRWQGSLRCGTLDLKLMKYAIDVCGRLDGILISHLDQIDDKSEMCVRYSDLSKLEDFKLIPSLDLKQQQVMGNRLRSRYAHNVPMTRESLVAAITAMGVKCVGFASGPTRQDRELVI